MMSKALLLALCLPVCWITACGDDGATGGNGNGNGTTEAPTGGGMTTATDESGATDSGETSPGSSTTMGVTDTSDPTSGGAVDPERAFYRVNSLELRDPHAFTLLGDSTAMVNGLLQGGLDADMTMPPDGLLDLGFVLAFRPLDQSEGASEVFQFSNASCTAPLDSTTCDALPADPDPYETTYASSASGECYAPDAANLSDTGTPPTPTSGPCFASERFDVRISAGAFALPLSNAVVSAQFVGNPAGNLVQGNIEGFVSRADAETTPVEGIPTVNFLVDVLRDEDMDMGDTGWVFHLSFTAVPVDWTGQ